MSDAYVATSHVHKHFVAVCDETGSTACQKKGESEKAACLVRTAHRPAGAILGPKCR